MSTIPPPDQPDSNDREQSPTEATPPVHTRTDPDRGTGEMGTEGTDPSWLILPKDDEEPTHSPVPDEAAED